MNTVIVSAAGSGKTTHIIKSAISDTRKIGIFTFTNDNEEQIKSRMHSSKGYIPKNITILSWFSFLLKHGVRPYQSFIENDRINGINLVSNKSGMRGKGRFGPIYWGEDKPHRFYFDSHMRMYSDKIAKFVVRCNELSKGAVISRLRKLFDAIYIDEVQDFAGYDLEILKLIMMSGIVVHAVGDPRQCTYQTHIDQKYKKYSGANIVGFFQRECKGLDIQLDLETLGTSYRNNDSIVNLSSLLYLELPKPIAGNKSVSILQGVHFIPHSCLGAYLKTCFATQLRYSSAVKGINEFYPVMNMGKSKGLEFDSVVIFPTEDMKNWLSGKPTIFKDKTKALLYVAITRARHSVAIVVPEKEFWKIPDTTTYLGVAYKTIS